MTARYHPRQPGGFTLLEVLAALAVLGLVLLALGQGVQFGQQAWRGTGKAMAWPDQIEPLDRTLRQLVTQALTPDEVQSGGSAQNGPIQGGEAVLEVVARLPLPDGAATGGRLAPTEARLEVDGSHRLVLRLLPHLNVQWVTPPRGELVVLAEHVERIEFAYWSAAAGGGGQWVRTWPGPALPALVRIRLLFPAGDARHWPDIVAAPAVGNLASQRLPAGMGRQHVV